MTLEKSQEMDPRFSSSMPACDYSETESMQWFTTHVLNAPVEHGFESIRDGPESK